MPRLSLGHLQWLPLHSRDRHGLLGPVKQQRMAFVRIAKGILRMGLQAWYGLGLPQRAGPSQLCWLLALNLPLTLLLGGRVGLPCYSNGTSRVWLRAKAVAYVLPLGAS